MNGNRTESVEKDRLRTDEEGWKWKLAQLKEDGTERRFVHGPEVPPRNGSGRFSLYAKKL